MSELNRQQLCAELSISESTVRRLEKDGLPFTPVGLRAKRYDLAECKAWLKVNVRQPEKASRTVNTSASRLAVDAYTASFKKVKLRVMPSE